MNSDRILAAEQLQRELHFRRSSSDPYRFARSVGIIPDDWQLKFLLSRAKRRIFNIARQMGKSTVAALAASHKAMYQPKTLTLCISPSERQSKELLRTARGFLHQLEAETLYDSTTEIELGNRSRIISLPASESTIRGYTAHLIIEDEAGDVPDDVYYAMLPMIIASKGDLVLMGTPKGRRGHFFDAWERGGPDWERYQVKAAEGGRTDLAELERQRRAMGARFAQEFEASFIDVAEGLVYGGFDERRNLIVELPLPLNHENWRFMLGVDFGFHDACAFVVIGYLPGDKTIYVISSHKETGMHPSRVAAYISELPYKFSRILGDEGGLGKGYAEELRREFHIPIEPAEKTNKGGFIDLINGSFAESQLKICKHTNAALVEELVSLPWAEGRKREADGYENHLTDALLYVWRACTAYLTKPKLDMRTEAQKETEAFAKARYLKYKQYHDAPKASEIDPVLNGIYE